MSELRVGTSGPLRGEVNVPGDKSVSHRALLFNALATGSSRVRGLLEAGDVAATRRAVQALGVEVGLDGTDTVIRASGRLVEPDDVIDCGNAGTAMRLLAGVIAADPVFAVLTGDGSLRRRPMRRVAEPLRRMGARVDGRDDGARAPITVRGAVTDGGAHDLSVASAQVKTAILLAGRRVGVSVREPGLSRDHSERMLTAMGASLSLAADGWLRLDPVGSLTPVDVDVPGDISSAAFWLVAGSITEGSEIVLRRVGVNPTRAGVIDVLRAMGADITVLPIEQAGAEPVADLVVRHAALRGVRIDGDLALRALDELPVLSVAASYADGETVIADAEELRVKESDRIARVASGLRALGIGVEERPDGMVIQGGRPRGPATIDARGDHRIAMSFAVAAAAGAGDLTLLGAEEIGSSYPTFLSDLEALRGRHQHRD